jgi:hypothetical protein
MDDPRSRTHPAALGSAWTDRDRYDLRFSQGANIGTQGNIYQFFGYDSSSLPPSGPSKARVFVGYEPQDSKAADVAGGVAKRLETEGCEVLMLTTADGHVTRWRDDLYTVLGYAHAAVLVLSPAALVSELFAQAWSLLAVRRYTDDVAFVLQPVLLDPLTPAALQHTPMEPLATFSPILGGDAEMIAGQVSERLASLREAPPSTLLEVLAEQVAKMLRAFGSGDLKDLLKNRIGWAPEDAPALTMQVALALWRRRLTEALVPPLRKLLGQSGLKELVQRIAPSWVDPWAAHGIVVAVGPNARAPQVRAVGLTGVGSDADAEFVGRCYWQRAYCAADPPGLVIPVNNSSSPGGAAPLREEIYTAVAHAVGLDPAAPIAQLRSHIMQRMRKPAFVVIPPPLLHPSKIQELLSDDTLTSIIFVLLNDTPLSPDVMSTYSGVLFLQPAPHADEVAGALNIYYQYG